MISAVSGQLPLGDERLLLPSSLGPAVRGMRERGGVRAREPCSSDDDDLRHRAPERGARARRPGRGCWWRCFGWWRVRLQLGARLGLRSAACVLVLGGRLQPAMAQTAGGPPPPAASSQAASDAGRAGVEPHRARGSRVRSVRRYRPRLRGDTLRRAAPWPTRRLAGASAASTSSTWSRRLRSTSCRPPRGAGRKSGRRGTSRRRTSRRPSACRRAVPCPTSRTTSLVCRGRGHPGPLEQERHLAARLRPRTRRRGSHGHAILGLLARHRPQRAQRDADARHGPEDRGFVHRRRRSRRRRPVEALPLHPALRPRDERPSRGARSIS